MDAAGDGNEIQMAELDLDQQQAGKNHPTNDGGGAINGDHIHMDVAELGLQQGAGENHPPNDGGGAINGDHIHMDVAELAQQEGAGGNLPPPAAAAAGGGGGCGPHAPSFDANDAGTLLVVATLITALSYQVGTNIPGGYWQDDTGGHVAGDPIMRDKHRKRYWLFMAASWAGFGSSMLLTVALVTGVPTKSRVVRLAFLVAYSSLVLTFVTSQPRTSLAMDIAIWGGVMAALGVVTSYLRLDRLPRWAQAVFCQLLGR